MKLTDQCFMNAVSININSWCFLFSQKWRELTRLELPPARVESVSSPGAGPSLFPDDDHRDVDLLPKVLQSQRPRRKPSRRRRKRWKFTALRPSRSGYYNFLSLLFILSYIDQDDVEMYLSQNYSIFAHCIPCLQLDHFDETTKCSLNNKILCNVLMSDKIFLSM